MLAKLLVPRCNSLLLSQSVWNSRNDQDNEGFNSVCATAQVSKAWSPTLQRGKDPLPDSLSSACVAWTSLKGLTHTKLAREEQNE